MSDEPELRDLPTLERWGERLREAAEREERPSGRRRFPVRRLAVGVAVMLAAVPGAVATRSIWVDPIDRVDPIRDPHSTPALRLAEGRSGATAWRLGAFDQSDGRRCVQLQITSPEQDLAGGCSAPQGGRAEIVMFTGDHDDMGFVFGTVAPDVAEVDVTVAGGRIVRVSTQTPDPESLRRSGMPRLRTYVAAFAHGFDAMVPPVVVARAAGGRVLGEVGGAP